jgi:hypothetical protein
VEDHHVDRPDVEARQRAQLTGTNRSFGLIVLVAKELQKSEARNQKQSARESALQTSDFWFLVSALQASFASKLRPLPAWWLLQGDKTRSHPELGRQTPQRQWYFVSRHGRVGRRQACKARSLFEARNQKPEIGSRNRFSSDFWLLISARSSRAAAGWSSPVARQAHNLKAAGSNPAPATKLSNKNKPFGSRRAAFSFPKHLTHFWHTFDAEPET